MQARITKRTVDAIKPAAKHSFLWDSGDSAVKGFGVKVTPAGRKVYLFQYRMARRGSATRRYTIGEHGAWTADKARERAETLGRMVGKNIDPLKQEREVSRTRRRRTGGNMAGLRRNRLSLRQHGPTFDADRPTAQ